MENEYENMDMQELFEEVIILEGGDLWDGCSSKSNTTKLRTARAIFERRLKELVDFHQINSE